MVLTVVLFILLLGVLILVHEWGHFIVARKLGVRVEEFAFGFPPRVASYTRRGTRYALNLLPLGGYVKIFGESGESSQDPQSFSSRPLGQRFWIIIAGVLMNVILAWFLFSLGHGLGLPTVLDEGELLSAGARVTIVGIAPGSPAQKAGLRFGDAIQELKVKSLSRAESRYEKVKVEQLEEVQQFIEAHRGEEISIAVRRGGEFFETVAQPRLEPPSGEGPLGIAMARVGIVRSPWWRAPWDGLKTTLTALVAITRALVSTLKDLLVRGEVAADVAGPVGIFAFADETRRLGMVYLIELAGILSVNLAILNILPIPALDGGRVLFLFIEKLKGRRVRPALEQAIHTIGLVMLLTLMAVITYRDIVRIF
ncbi:MAG: site-2 protease family protein [Patescibacteria group bacterium]